jgi:hypothetical protein
MNKLHTMALVAMVALGCRHAGAGADGGKRYDEGRERKGH